MQPGRGDDAPRVGLVLGAGGVAGSAFHAGVLAAVEEVTGWDPRRATVVAGTSAGAITAATLRAGRPCSRAGAPGGPRTSPPGWRAPSPGRSRPGRWR